MSSRLDRITDWAARAGKSGYRVGLLANELGVSARYLTRYMERRFNSSPHQFLARLRAQKLRELLRDGVPPKSIAKSVGFSELSGLCHSLRKDFQVTLRAIQRQAGSEKDN